MNAFSIRIWYKNCSYSYKKIIAGEMFFCEYAEGATTPETLRQKDCNNFKNLERSILNMLTEGDGQR